MRNGLLWLAMGCLAGVATAQVASADKLVEAGEPYWNPMPQGTYSDVQEVEPNGSFAAAQSITSGDIVHAAITGSGGAAGDLDYFVFTVPPCAVITFGTEADGASPVADTYIYLYDSGLTLVAADDDAGPGFYSLITYRGDPAGGTYYGMVRSYSSTQTGTYKAFLWSLNPPPGNDTCPLAFDIPCGGIDLSGSTWCMANDYTPLTSGTGGCTGYSAGGRDVVYRFAVGANGAIDISYTSTADASVYIVADCADVAGTCVAGADATFSGDPERIDHTFAAGGTYYLILDSYGPNSWGEWTLTGSLSCGPVRVQNTSWGVLKNVFR